jgi:hypothetical protein
MAMGVGAGMIVGGIGLRARPAAVRDEVAATV